MRWLSMIPESPIWTREFRLDIKPIVRLVHERPEAVILGIGVLLRVVVYLSNRSMWLDEMSLTGNIVGKPVLDFSENLTNDQLAPFGFLIVQRALVRILGDSNFALRVMCHTRTDRRESWRSRLPLPALLRTASPCRVAAALVAA